MSVPPLKQTSSVDYTSRSVAAFSFQLGVTAAANALLLWFFYNRFWYAPDEGNYAHVAQRVVSGEVLNLNVQDIHPGYINFVNAASLRLFGLDLVSLRYPLVAIAFVQAILVFLLFYRSGRKQLAVIAAIGINALGLVQYLDPTSNWYSLFVTILIVCALEWIPREARARLFVAGFLVGTVVLFRQLTGALVCIAVLAYLLLEARSPTERVSVRDLVLARLLIVIMALGLGVYLLRTSDAIGISLFGACPLILLFWLFVRTTTKNRHVLKMIGVIAAGGIVACLPLLAYHLLHGSVRSWLNDTVFSAIGLTKLPFMDVKLYGRFIFAAGWRLFHTSHPGELINSVYWLVLPLLAFFNGLFLLRLVIGRENEPATTARGTYALPVIALFYGIVSLHFQIPLYIYYTAGFSLAALMWLLPFERRFQYSAFVLALALSLIAVYYHAGQPITNQLADVLGGRRNITTLNQRLSSLPRASLKIQANEEKPYADVLHVIETETQPADTIFAVPTNAEFYFLSGRRNPFRFYNTALGIRRDSDLQRVKETIVEQPPRLVIYRPDDKYNTDAARQIMDLVKQRYEFLGDVDGFEIYRSR